MVETEAVEAIATSILGKGCNSTVPSQLRFFKAHFGVSPFIAATVWNKLMDGDDGAYLIRSGTHIHHLLWCFLFLKIYGTEDTMSSLVKCDRKTFRFWTYFVLLHISKLKMVSRRISLLAAVLVTARHLFVTKSTKTTTDKFVSSTTLLFLFACLQIDWNNRYIGNNGSRCLASIDGTDFQIQEPSPFNPCWYSHKFRGPGVRYEIGVGLQNGDIVWVNGPFPCGSHSDRKIANNEGLLASLGPGEYFLADGGYRGAMADTPTGLNNADQRMKALARARHETVNGRFKQFGCMRQIWRHDLQWHKAAMFAVVNIAQIVIEEELPLFVVDYNDALDVDVPLEDIVAAMI
jgi:muconolactone delta-isomerase